jgi:hypothetical protein
MVHEFSMTSSDGYAHGASIEYFEKALEKAGVDSRLGETTELEVIGASSRIIHDTSSAP